jgi:hypothetical protein
MLRFNFAIWWDPHWRSNFRRSWKQRRFWLANVPYIVIPDTARTLALQFGPVTLKFVLEGKFHG